MNRMEKNQREATTTIRNCIRKQHSKAYGGCTTCKTRHAECDETMPVCRQCAKRGRVCYYNPPKPWLFEPFKVHQALPQKKAARPNDHVKRSSDISDPASTTTSKSAPQLAVPVGMELGEQFFVNHTLTMTTHDRQLLDAEKRAYIAGMTWAARHGVRADPPASYATSRRRSSFNTNICHSLSDLPDWSFDEKHDLSFFLGTFGENMRKYSDGAFFNQVAPVIAEQDTGIRYLLLAISSLYSQAFASVEPSNRQRYWQALERCNLATQRLRHYDTSPSFEVLSVSCVLLACFHLLQLDIDAAKKSIQMCQQLVHLSGRQAVDHRLKASNLRTDCQAEQLSKTSSMKWHIQSTISKSVLFSVITWSYRLSSWEVDDLSAISCRIIDGPILDRFDVLVASERMRIVCRRIRRNITHQAYIDPNCRFGTDLRSQLDCFDRWLQEAKANSDRTLISSHWIDYARSVYNVLLIVTHCKIFGNVEVSYDHFTDQFKTIVNFAQTVLESSTAGGATFVFNPFTPLTVESLYFVAVHCREPQLRRRAKALLLKHRRIEAGFDSWIAGQVVDRVLDLEEAGLDVQSASDIPESHRIRLRGFEKDDRSNLQMLYVRSPYTGPGRFERTSIEIHSDPAAMLEIYGGERLLNALEVLYNSFAQPDARLVGRTHIAPMSYKGALIPVVSGQSRLPSRKILGEVMTPES